MNQLTLKNVTFSYDENVNAVEDINLEVSEGQYVTIIGHNGSGKSTITKLIIGLLEAKSGEIFVDGVALTPQNVYDIREKIAIVFQNPDNQFIGSTVRDDIAFGLENQMVDPSRMDAIIDEFSSRVGMESYLEHEPTKLSGGQKQRVAIAGALAMKPEILVLDEATSMLDPKGRKEVNELVHELHTKNNMTILSITHDIEEVLLSDYVFVMSEGKLVMQGLPQEILDRAQELVELQLDIPFTVKFFNALKDQGIIIEEKFDLKEMVEKL